MLQAAIDGLGEETSRERDGGKLQEDDVTAKTVATEKTVATKVKTVAKKTVADRKPSVETVAVRKTVATKTVVAEKIYTTIETVADRKPSVEAVAVRKTVATKTVAAEKIYTTGKTDGMRGIAEKKMNTTAKTVAMDETVAEKKNVKVITCKLLNELTQLQKQVRDETARVVPTRDVRGKATSLLETAIIGRAAEALRRQKTDGSLIKVAAREEVYRRTTQKHSTNCNCYLVTKATLDAGVLATDTTSDPRLTSAVTRVLKATDVGQLVDLNSHQISNYDFNDEEDLELIQEARWDERNNIASYQILMDSLCVDSRQTAEAKINGLLAEEMMIVATPPVAAEEIVSAAE